MYSSFRRFCMDIKHLPTDLHILISDILQGSQPRLSEKNLIPFILGFIPVLTVHIEVCHTVRVAYKALNWMRSIVRVLSTITIYSPTSSPTPRRCSPTSTAWTNLSLSGTTRPNKHDRVYLALVKSDLSSVRYCKSVHRISPFLRGTKNTRLCITGPPVS